MIKIDVRLFGAFRKYGENISLSVPSGSSMQEIKNKLAEELSLTEMDLINDSAMANDNEIIGSDFIFTQDSELAILPPVCGG